MLAKVSAEHGTRLGVVGGAGSLHVTEGGPRVVDLPTFPEAHKGEARLRPTSWPRCAKPRPTSTGST